MDQETSLVPVESHLASPVYNPGDCYKENHENPHGFVQWKGTSVCLDVYCVCGVHGHIDDEFVYYVECAKCGRVFEVNPHVRLHEVPGGAPPNHCKPKVFEGRHEVVDADK